MVRATCSNALTRPPPGRMNECSGCRSSWQWSSVSSSALISLAPTRNIPSCWAAGGVASSAPRSKSSLCRRRSTTSSSLQAGEGPPPAAVDGAAAPEAAVGARALPEAAPAGGAPGVGRALAADEVGLALVAASGVDARDPDRHGILPTVGRRGLSTRGARGSARHVVRTSRVPLDDGAQLLRIDRLLVDDVVQAGELAALDDVVLVEVERGHQDDG